MFTILLVEQIMKNGNSEDMEILSFIPDEETTEEQQDYTKVNAIIKNL